MTALMLENLAALPACIARALDAQVSGIAARSVPEWRMRQVQSEIVRFEELIKTDDKMRPAERRKTVDFANGLVRSEAAT